MAEEKDSASDFKVVDRRTFSDDGTRREGARPEEMGSEARPIRRLTDPPTDAAVRLPTDSASSPHEAEHPAYEEGAANFEMLVSYLSTTAMFQLGALPGPAGERIPADLPNARRTIDLLEVLEEKTRGNLSPNETQLLQDILYELRLIFVEVERGPSKKRK